MADLQPRPIFRTEHMVLWNTWDVTVDYKVKTRDGKVSVVRGSFGKDSQDMKWNAELQRRLGPEPGWLEKERKAIFDRKGMIPNGPQNKDAAAQKQGEARAVRAVAVVVARHAQKDNDPLADFAISMANGDINLGGPITPSPRRPGF